MLQETLLPLSGRCRGMSVAERPQEAKGIAKGPCLCYHVRFEIGLGMTA